MAKIMLRQADNTLFCTFETDLIFRKVNESDASQFARMCPIMGARGWGCLWLLIAFVFFAAGIVAGLAAVSRRAFLLPERS